MNNLRLFLIVFTVVFSNTKGFIAEAEDDLIAELQITDLELQDDWDELEHGRKSSILNNNITKKMSAEEIYSAKIKMKSENLKRFDNIPYEVIRNCTVITKSGDVLLETEDWTNLITYHNTNLELLNLAKVSCSNNIQGCFFDKSGYRNILKESKDEKLLKETWKSWQNLLTHRKSQFPSILDLIKKAAIANDEDIPNEKSYWETLLDYEGAYDAAQNVWEEIEPFYRKLHAFVQRRIFDFYNITLSSESIPVYLLGSNFGDDWSHIANIILPHPQLHYDIESAIERKNVTQVYKLAEALTDQLSLGFLGEPLWSNSLFNMSTCDDHIFSFVSDNPHSEILTCNKTSWVRYLDSFERATRLGLDNLDLESLPRRNLRYSVLDDAVVSLGSLSAINNLVIDGILPADTFPSSEFEYNNDTKKLTRLLLSALRIFPKLAYYRSADQFRLNYFKDPSMNLSENWWKIRRDIQGVEGVTNLEDDYLADPYITSNRPYLSKFFGLILQFHIVSSYTISMEDPEGNFAFEIGADDNFKSMLENRPADSWPNLISTYLGVYEITAGPLLDYFQPLEKYFRNAPLQQVQIIKTTSTPVKTTTTTTAKTTTTISEDKVEISSMKPLSNDGKRVVSQGDKPTVSEAESVSSNIQTSGIAMHLGIGMLIGVAIISSFFIIKKVRKRWSSPQRNRRFET